MVKKTSQIILLSLFVVLTATAQKREKYEFMRNLPVYADSLIAGLTYPMAWPGAILIPNESIGTERPEELPDLHQIILIYCRSGNRSKQAAQKLADMGYANIYEFGGIIDWTGEVVTTQQETDGS